MKKFSLKLVGPDGQTKEMVDEFHGEGDAYLTWVVWREKLNREDGPGYWSFQELKRVRPWWWRW